MLIGLLRTRKHKGERKADDLGRDSRHIMEGDFALAHSYAAMSPAMIPTIPTRIEHWPTSLIISGHESSSSLSLSPSSSTESISSMSTDFIYFSCVGGIGELSSVLAAPGSTYLDSLCTSLFTAFPHIRSSSYNQDN